MLFSSTGDGRERPMNSAISGELNHSSSNRAAPGVTSANALPMADASAGAPAISAQTWARSPRAAAATWATVVHSSNRRRDNAMRQQARRTVSRATSASIAMNTTASIYRQA